jgi:carbonic anhydrase
MMSESAQRPEGLEKNREDFRFEAAELLKKTGYTLGYERPLIVRCFDSRLDTVFEAFLKENGWSHKDVISLPGGARALASRDEADAAARETVFQAIKTSIAAHDAKWILLTIHWDCKGYGIAFSSDKAERETQKRDIAEAVRYVSQNLSPEFFVEGRYVDGHGIHPV